MTSMDNLIKDMLAEMPDPVTEGQQFIDLDNRVPPPVRLPADKWAEILNEAKNEFEVDGATAVFSTWRVEAEDPLDIGDIDIDDGMYARAGQLALDARMTVVRATHILAALPRASSCCESSSCVSGAKATGSLKTSLTQSGLRGKRGWALSRSRGIRLNL